MSLLRYPKIRHKRRLFPPKRSSYKYYKPHLREEFYKTCVYCRLPDKLLRIDSFGVDHYRPWKKFPNLVAEYSNLFYSCNCCNRRKSDFWPTEDQLKDGYFIPNPCDQVLFQHLRYEGVLVLSKSKTGEFTVELLDLNDDLSVEYRQNLLDICASIELNFQNVRKTISQLDKRIKTATDNEMKLKLEEEKIKHEQNLNRLIELINDLYLITN